jgi:S1-C subfamily serine protease
VFDTAGSGLVIRDLPPEGTPVWDAGLAQDDVIVRLDDTPVDSRFAWDRAIARQQPGRVVSIEVERRGEPSRLSLRIGDNPEVEVTRVEGAGGRLAPRQEAFRRAWLDSRVAVPAVR